jgi:hypothetical protein
LLVGLEGAGVPLRGAGSTNDAACGNAEALAKTASSEPIASADAAIPDGTPPTASSDGAAESVFERLAVASSSLPAADASPIKRSAAIIWERKNDQVRKLQKPRGCLPGALGGLSVEIGRALLRWPEVLARWLRMVHAGLVQTMHTYIVRRSKESN